MHQTSQGIIRAVSEVKDYFQIHEWQEEEWVLKGRIPIELQNIYTPRGEYSSPLMWDAEEDHYWYYNKDGRCFQSMNATGGLGQRGFINDVSPGANSIMTDLATIKTVAGKTYLYRKARDRPNALYQLDNTDNLFKPSPWAPASWWGRQVTADQQGNCLFIFQSKGGETKAILEDQFGKRYDYSAFFTTIPAHTVRGHNFKERLLTVGEHGFQLHVVKDETAISTILQDSAIRAMINLSREEVLIGTESRDLFVYNRASKTFTSHIKRRFDRGYFKFLQEKEGQILTSGTNGFYLLDLATDMESGAHVTAAGVWTNASDRNKKYEITDLTYGLAELRKLRPTAYRYKADHSASVGFIAQELKLIIPEVVSGEEGEMGVAYGLLTAILTKGVQELADKNEQLEQQLHDQQAKIDRLEAQLTGLEKLEQQMAELKAAIEKNDDTPKALISE
ncbi:MAG: tail fiber domain-containing protein [Bacteroidota bacterium]